MNHVSIAQFPDQSWAYQLKIPGRAMEGHWWPGFATAQAALEAGLCDLDKAKDLNNNYFLHLGLIWFQYFEGRRGNGLPVAMQERDKRIAALQRVAVEHPERLEPPKPVERVAPAGATGSSVKIKLDLSGLL